MDERKQKTLIHRILSGSLIFTKDERQLELVSPSLFVKQESDLVYWEHYHNNIYEFILKEDLKPLLLKAELIGPFYEKDLERIIKNIEKAKIQLYLDFWDRTKTKRNRKTIENYKKAQTKLMGKGMAFDHLTLEHYCHAESVRYQISQTLRDLKTKELIFDSDTPKQYFESVLLDINEHSIDILEIRELARTEYWKNYYNSTENGNVFGRPIGDLNPEQLSMLTTTRMYNKVMEHPEAPDQVIMQDDDALDGWVLYQTEKSKEDKKKTDKKDSKIGNAQEVFYMAENQEQRQDILALNTNASEHIQKNRMNQVMNSTKAVDSADFQDVRQTLNEAVANKQKKV